MRGSRAILGLLPALLAVGGMVHAASERAAPARSLQVAEADEWGGLPAGVGREEVYSLCGACHSLMIVKQQGLSREAWDETLVWMVEEQGMPELDAESLALVLDYLADHYGADRRNR
ncbi:MAG: hypothetical protein QNJ67_01555 [Kiloniellales bacterium]|nr:hypothetical protein [Kiloniellales bacterium]